MALLIALTGAREAGKDTAFKFIQEWASERSISCHRRGFADALKLSFARMFIPDCSLDEGVNWCDELKDPDSRSWLSVSWARGYRGRETETRIEHSITGRQVLQRYGTEAHRDVFDENFWVDALLPTRSIINEHDLPEGPAWPYNFRGPMDMQPPQICVITDTRFVNEAERVKLLGGVIWRVVREGQELLDEHASEVPLPSEFIDAELLNIWGKMENLRERVRAEMEITYANI